MTVAVHLNVPDPEWAGSVPEARVGRGVSLVLEEHGIREGEISVTFVSDEQIRRLNLEYLGHDRPTDVLSFALHSEGEPVLGDVYVGVEVARRQAAEHEVSLEEELVRLAVHGTLHVLGHDHPEGEEREASELFQRQEAVVRRVMG